MAWLLLLFWLPTAASASTLKEAFASYLNVRKAEESLKVDGPQPSLNTALAQARQKFQETIKIQEQNPKWVQAALHRMENRGGPFPARKEAEAFLAENFPSPRELSALEWQAIEECFGSEAQEDFLKKSFALSELKPAKEKTEKLPAIAWVRDPFRKLLANKEKIEKADLEKAGTELIPIEISAFPQVDDQAEELRQSLLSLGEKPVIVVTSGGSSAVMLRLLDLYPGLRERESIKGWVNVDGNLYGSEIRQRGPASIEEQATENALTGYQHLRLDGLVREAPLGDGFPIVNLLSMEKSRRPAQNLREAIVAQGASWFVAKGAAGKSLRGALPLLSR